MKAALVDGSAINLLPIAGQRLVPRYILTGILLGRALLTLVLASTATRTLPFMIAGQVTS